MTDQPKASALPGVQARLRSLWRGLRHRADIEAEMTDEFRHHLALRTEDLIRQGVAPADAARQARIEFGHVEGHKEDARVSRGLRAFDQVRFSWLDVTLGMRMLARYPGLTLVGGLAMAFAIAMGAGTFHFVNQFLDPKLPLPAGERVIGLRYWDRTKNMEVTPLPSDLRSWGTELRTVEHLGGFRTVERNLSVGSDAGQPVRVAEMSPSGFRVAGIPPLLGRVLVDADAEAGAPMAIVLGYRVWQTRLGGDPAVVGRTIRLGENEATIVGVMPGDFAFPRDHMAWTPLRLNGAGSSEPLRVFGRLTPGATLETTLTEATALLARVTPQEPQRYEPLRVQALPYAESLSGINIGLRIRVMVHQFNVFAAVFLVLVSANVALLMFARTATREREIVVRTALGASRGRIVMQLFIEALVLAILASVIGLAATAPALGWVTDALTEIGADLPFWFDPTVSMSTAAYAALLALLSAAVAGVVPALKATGHGMRARLNQVSAGAGGLRLGGIWTGVVVTQIAATVAFTGVAYVLARQAARAASVETYFPASQYLGVRLEMDRELLQGADTTRAGLLLRYAGDVRELERRLGEHPSVTGVTLAEQLPVKAHAGAVIEMDDAGAGPDSARTQHEIFSEAVQPNFFEVLGAPILAGRGFDSRDLSAGGGTVIVTASFVEEVVQGRSAIGRRIRYVTREEGSEPGQWQEIVGVVQDLVTDRTRSLDLTDPPRARIYHALDPMHALNYPLHVVAHIRGNPQELVPVLHEMATAISPGLQVHEPLTLDRANSDLAKLWSLYAELILAVSAIALFLSLAGIYAVMSFTVSRRTREIGVRVALGAQPRRVIAEVFRSPFVQVGAGVAIGCLMMGALVWMLTEGRATAHDGLLLLAWGVGMIAICGLACIGPTLRALRVEPAEALSTEG